MVLLIFNLLYLVLAANCFLQPNQTSYLSWHISSAKNTVFNLKSIFFRDKAKINRLCPYNFVNFQLTLLLRHFAAKCCKSGLGPKTIIIWEFLVCFFNQTFIDVFSRQTNAGNKHNLNILSFPYLLKWASYLSWHTSSTKNTNINAKSSFSSG